MIEFAPTNDDVTKLYQDLMGFGIGEVIVKSTLDRASEPKRMVFSAFQLSTEIAVGFEGSGFIILSTTDRVNDFRFIEAGFQIGAARIAVALFNGLAALSRPTTPINRAQPQLEDRRS